MNIFGWGKTPHITTYTREGKVDLKSLPSREQPHESPRDVSDEGLTAALKTLKDQRREELKGGPAVPVAPPVPKDASVSPKSFYMAQNPEDCVSLDFIKQMAQVGRVEGFHVYASGMGESVPNVTNLSVPGKHGAWTEDYSEFTTQGEVVIPALLAPDTPIEEWSIEDRGRRYHGTPMRAGYGAQGLVNEHSRQKEGVGLGLAAQVPKMKMAVSYVEGGNLQPGRRADGTPFALVGKDSIAITREIMREQTGNEEITDAQAQAQIARDYGLEQVIPIEQPGEFHLDMSMTLARPGQVLLNDARQVAELQKGWVTEHYAHKWLKSGQEEDLKKIDEQANKVAVYEDQVEKDLKAAGLEVLRVPGSFPETSVNQTMNFLNMRQGEHYAVALGGDERAEQAFANVLLQDGYDRVHFLDRDLTPQTLEMNGGLKCRTKPHL